MQPPSSTKSTILLVHASAELYGSDRACLTIASGAVAAGFEMHVIVPTKGPLIPLLESAGATVHILDPLILRRAELRGLDAFRTVARWPATVLRLRRFSRQLRFDLVHSNCAPTVGGALLARWWGVPHIWHVHEIFEDQRSARIVFERLLSSADVLLVASGAVANQFRSQALKARCRVVYTGGDVPADIVGVNPLSRSPVELICVGRLNQWKGQEFLIQAVGALRERGVDVDLKLVGDVYAAEHHFREQLEQLVTRLGLDSFVTLLGERRDALHLIAEADIVVVPSAQPEPFGIVVVEAMALGRPIVATDAGGPREMITSGEDGILVAPRDATALANAIEKLVTDPSDGRRLGINARTTAQRFSTAEMTRSVLAMYHMLLNIPTNKSFLKNTQ
jgi:glycosyltransferase involved in cell wall biosynthesis